MFLDKNHLAIYTFENIVLKAWKISQAKISEALLPGTYENNLGLATSALQFLCLEIWLGYE